MHGLNICILIIVLMIMCMVSNRNSCVYNILKNNDSRCNVNGLQRDRPYPISKMSSINIMTSPCGCRKRYKDQMKMSSIRQCDAFNNGYNTSKTVLFLE